MALFFFHCTDGSDLEADRMGFKAENLDEILAHAVFVARRLMWHSRTRTNWAGWMVAVMDSFGHAVATVPFPPMPEKKPRPPRAAGRQPSLTAAPL